jgi:hypothetical protein
MIPRCSALTSEATISPAALELQIDWKLPGRVLSFNLAHARWVSSDTMEPGSRYAPESDMSAADLLLVQKWLRAFLFAGLW